LGYYLLVCLGSSSGFGRWLKSMGIELIFTLNGAIIAAAVVTFPLVLKPIQAAFDNIPTILTDAAKVIGLNYPANLIAVIVPLAWNSVLAGLLLGFAAVWVSLEPL
jgi:molybdate transport system permease protein